MVNNPQPAVAADFPFYKYLRLFYEGNEGAIREHYKKLSLKFLDFNDPSNANAFLRNRSLKRWRFTYS